MRSRQDNAFDLLRLVGAVGVVAQHSWVLAGSGDPMGPFKGVSLMVDAFFAASGYLITSSWLADPSARRFGLRRALRIYPAYAVVIVLAALVVGPLATDLSPGAYFGNPLTWEYLGKNLLILPMTYDLPGVFTGNPLPLVVNGSLWSLRLEMICYVLVALLGLARLVNLRVVSVLLGAMVTITVLVHATGHPGVLVPHLLLGSHAEQISLFLAGMLVRLSPRSISPPWWCVVVAWAVFPLARELEITYPLILLAVFLTSFAIAFRTPAVLHHPTGSFDLSYGIYIYAYPAQQLLAQAGVRSPLVMLLASVAILVPLGLASQLLLERPALRLKPRRPPPPALEVTDTGENRAATA